ncbi:YitT family protein [Clostridium tertium]|uniref:YitT family protein n=1 Tax=Clostridium TaxID=1485 RepID=UPI00232E3B51|nr:MULTISPECIES: YitT family protein [Clostridium]MBS4959145.1 YitT family protein [Clostridium sp.]MDB1922799.1 YitT family protein [Clostridium tertium]MDB1925919.1 YitT family protein [Clostridium tertium]MDB1929472.1 YitT family protein [Clostridium tertium]MDU1568580.1 YitT family protein [Clostridium sp.]
MKKLKEYILSTIGVAIVAFGLEYFFFPLDIAAGGVSGLALAINQLIDINPSVLVFIFNFILFALAFFLIGGSFGAKSIYATIMMSVIMWVFESFFEPKAITDNLVLACVFGSVVLALGTAITFYQDASTGGTSIIAKIINKYFHVPIGQGLLLADCTVTLLAIYSFGVEKGLFGLLSATLIGILVDKFIAGLNPVKQVFIITNKEKLVVDFINNDIDRGCTILTGKGGYTKENMTVVYTVLTSKQFIALKQFIKNNNPEAFLTVSESTEALGKGFTDY